MNYTDEKSASIVERLVVPALAMIVAVALAVGIVMTVGGGKAEEELPVQVMGS